MKLTILTLLLVVAAVFSAPADVKPRDKNNRPYKVVCYYGTWSYTRPGDGQFNAENINPYLCTHLNYAFAKLDEKTNKMVLFDPKLDDSEEHMIQRTANLRKLNPNMAVLISLGGWNEGSNKYSDMVSKDSSRKIFISSVVEFIQKYNLDGFDLDWEYPGFHANGGGDRQEGRKQDIKDYVTLLKELKTAFSPFGYILTAAVSAGKWTIDNAYDIKGINEHIDWINLMSYDLHGSWEHKLGHNSPLHAYSHEDWDVAAKQLTIEFAVNLWIERGMAPEKIVLGVPLYARTFKLGDQNHFKPGDTAIGSGGDKGNLTQESGMLGYNEICMMIKQGGWKTYWDDKAMVPYAVHANQWASYDNVKSVEEKVKWLISHKLGGGMIWSIETDDFHGLCGEGQYPLLKALSKNLNGIDGPDVKIPIPDGFTTPKHSSDQTPGSTTKNPNPQTDPQTDAPTTKEPKTDPPVTDKPDPSGKFKCTSAGFFKDPKDPRKFHQCVNFGGYFKDFVFECPEGTRYDDKLHVCV